MKFGDLGFGEIGLNRCRHISGWAGLTARQMFLYQSCFYVMLLSRQVLPSHSFLACFYSSWLC